MINFSIGGTPYQAEEGMTWEQWVNSKYNVANDHFSKWNNYLIADNYYTGAQSGISYTGVTERRLIVKNHDYITEHTGGSSM